MSRSIKRLLLLAAVGMLGAALFRARRQRATGATPPVAPASSWPPFERIERPVEQPVEQPIVTPDDEQDDERDVTEQSLDWVLPADGACPDGYPIKANTNSHIFHLPGGRFYERTIAERCYATAEAAERDGYRRAKA